ncbi:uncharacterized protein BX664DRAFT_356721 [Halteromyces radiatus]|uniref:uncharacterized protein n=1 Tax=Halteromyces radiatus TaxID=101107 RepID=UPI00221E541B|nr:uncharacterized protein BX664DRAFT_356721 [Halteromyces radiatus]KAI8097485.1 hypothetical protein BX664DRAFT_356721 [Halteromyces radiatus]
MKKTEPHKHGTLSEDLRLHNLYNALKSSHSSASIRYLERLKIASVSTIDQLLCKIASRARKTQQSTIISTSSSRSSDIWPIHRLLACFDVILDAMKQRSCPYDLLSIKSFKACVRLVLETLGKTDDNDMDITNEYGGDFTKAATQLNGSKCWCKLLEHLARLTRRRGTTMTTTKTVERGLVKAILKDIQLQQAHLRIFFWSTNVTEQDMSPYVQHSSFDHTMMTAKTYGLRGLFAQVSFFGSDLIMHGAYRRLVCQPLFFYFGHSSLSQHTEIAIASSTNTSSLIIGQQNHGRLYSAHHLSLCKAATQLLNALCKFEQEQQGDNETISHGQYSWIHFVGSSTLVSIKLARTWLGILDHLLQSEEYSTAQQTGTTTDTCRIFYCMTAVLMKLPPQSKVYSHLIPRQKRNSNNESTTIWYTALPRFFAQFIYYLQQTQLNGSQHTTVNTSQHVNDSIGRRQRTNILKSTYTLDILVKLLTRLCHISWRCLLSTLDGKTLGSKKGYDGHMELLGEKLTGYLTNTLMAFTAFPISVEALFSMATDDGNIGDTTGMNSTYLLSMDICADVVIRGYFGLTSTTIELYQTCLEPLLETLMQHLQVVRSSWRMKLGSRLAWCIRSQMSLLYADNKLDNSPLLSRFQKLVIYLLHDDGAIDQLAGYSTGLGKYIWEPTIMQARDGLVEAASFISSTSATIPTLSSSSSSSSTGILANNYTDNDRQPGPTSLHATSQSIFRTPQKMLQVLAKAKRALVALEKISRHPRACERLAETNILELVEVGMIPSYASNHTSSPFKISMDNIDTVSTGSTSNDDDYQRFSVLPIQVWTVYGLFVGLVASLAERTSLMRSKLRQEQQLVDVIMGILWSTIGKQSAILLQQQQQHQSSEDMIKVFQHVVKASIQVVYAYRYDSVAAMEWLTWKQEIEDGRSLTLVSALLAIVVPWCNETYIKTGCGEGDKERHWWMIYSGQINNASTLLEHLSLFGECGKQLIQDNASALQDITQWMAILSDMAIERSSSGLIDSHGINSVHNLEENMGEKIDGGDDDVENVQEEQLYMDYDGNDDGDVSSFIFCDNQDEDYKEDGDSDSNMMVDFTVLTSPTPSSDKTKCLAPLLRTLIKLITSRENLKLLILTDGFTRMFGPLLFTLQASTWHDDKMEAVLEKYGMGIQLGQALWKRVEDLKRLFQFFGQNEQDINHRHELTAVALVYASFWNIDHWQSTLGIFGFDTSQESIVYSTSPFGIICHMLMLDDDDDKQQQNDFSTTMEKKQGRRCAAAQAITLLAYSFRLPWQQQLDDALENNQQKLDQLLVEQMTKNRHLLDDSNNRIILLQTDDASNPIQVNSKDLTWISPAFAAMLSDHYAETTTESSIQLHDITLTSLQYFIHVSQLLQNHYKQQQQDDMITKDILDDTKNEWKDVMVVVHMADRYSSPIVQLLGERWIMKQIKKKQPDYLSGCLEAYLYLRDKYHGMDGGGLKSTSWPFGLILNQCMKALLLDTIDLIETTAFNNMTDINNNNNNSIEDIEAFCNAALVLLQHPSSSSSLD